MNIRSRRGFTMVELLASIGIIALSMAICLPVPENALDETELAEESPVTVRLFECVAEGRTFEEAERECREALTGSDMQFCGLEDLGGGRFSLAIWTPVDMTSDSNRAELRSRFASSWTIGDEVGVTDELVAVND